MSKSYKQHHTFILFFSLFTSTSFYAEHARVELTAHYKNQSHNSNRSHADFSHHGIKNHSGFDRSSGHKHQFNTYTANDFQQHFTAHGHTENQVLNQRCLYMFDEFVQFAKTYNGYKCTIQQLHAELKNLTLVQKAHYTVKGTYCAGLQKRIHFLYNELNNVKTTQPDSSASYNRNSTAYKQCLELMSKNAHSVLTFNKQLPEYNTLDSTYSVHVPSLSNAIEKRVEAYNGMSNNDIQYTTKIYNLNNNVQQLLYKHGHDTAQFNQCFGTPLDHALHHESLDILERIDCLPHNSLLHDHQDALIDFTVAMVDYNHEGLTDKAMDIADLCWTLLDYGQAVAEGAALGVHSAATDILTNPIEATINIVAGKQVLAYQLTKVMYNVADIGVTAITNFEHAKDKWQKYTEPLNNIIDAIYNKEMTVRDAIKGGTAFVVGYKTQGKLLGGLGKFCNTIKQKSINFVKNSSLLNPQEYLTTPEGLLFKATSQAGKPKQSGQTTTASNVKNNVESKLSKNNSLNNGKTTTSLTGNPSVNKGIIRNTKEDLRSTIKEYESHIFSEEHKEKGILALGKNQETIMDSMYDTIMSLDKKGLLQEGPNQLRVKINGIDNVEIRCFIQSGEAISVNAFISDFGRIFNNFIDTTKV